MNSHQYDCYLVDERTKQRNYDETMETDCYCERKIQTVKKPKTHRSMKSSMKLSNVILLLIGLLFCFATITMAAPHDSEVTISPKLTDVAETEATVASGRGPRVAMVRKSNTKKCPKPDRKTFCLNKGRCEWIIPLNTMRCKCRPKWVGTRCEVPIFDFNQDTPSSDNTDLIVALVVSIFGLIGILLVGCICWRRMKSIKNKRQQKKMLNCEATDERMTILTMKNDKIETSVVSTT